MSSQAINTVTTIMDPDTEELNKLKEKLQSDGYYVHVPINSHQVNVMGKFHKQFSSKNFFNAKGAKAKSIESDLRHLGYNVKSKKNFDGFYDFWVTL
jgi:hypothetical protein